MSVNKEYVDYQPIADSLKDKIIAITGAGDGIGRAAALGFAKHGAIVILLGRTIQKLEKVYDQIVNDGGAEPAIYPINFEGATEQDYQDLAQNFVKEFDHLDGLLHNASELGQRTPLAQYSAKVWNSVLQTNVTAPFLLTRELIPLLEKAPQASVVFTGSSVGHQGRAYWGAYAVSKAATENLMQVFADELSETTHIRVNSINPGATRTKMRANAYPGEEPSTLKKPEAILGVYYFLMGDESVGRSGEQFNAQSR
jgi:NAD(P)-dependent dehydrogenase (short-subunit alcohol dehydrogenase family)